MAAPLLPRRAVSANASSSSNLLTLVCACACGVAHALIGTSSVTPPTRAEAAVVFVTAQAGRNLSSCRLGLLGALKHSIDSGGPQLQGRSVQVDPIKPTLKAPGSQTLKL